MFLLPCLRFGSCADLWEQMATLAELLGDHDRGVSPEVSRSRNFSKVPGVICC